MMSYGNLVRPLCLTKAFTENGVLGRINEILQPLISSFCCLTLKTCNTLSLQPLSSVNRPLISFDR